MRKIKNIFMNLLGAAAIAACAAGTALAQFTGDFASGGAIYTNDADQSNSIQSQSGIGVAVDTMTVGGPYVYTVNVSSTGFMYPAGSNAAYLVLKYGPAGVLVSSVTFRIGGSSAERPAIAVGPGGNIYVAGAVAETPFSSSSAFDGLVLRYAPNLTLISSATFRYIDGGKLDTFRAIAADASGVYVTGTSETNAVTNDQALVAVKYSPTLAFISSATTTGPAFSFFTGNGFNELGNAIANTPAGVYVAGFVNTRPFGGAVCSIFRLTTSMVFVSTVALQGADTCSAAAASANGFYVTGSTGIPPSTYAAVTAKFDYNLALQSSATFAGGGYSMGYGAAADSSGNIYVSGLAMTGTEDFMLLKYDQALNLVSSRSYVTAGSDYGYGVAVDSAAAAYAAMYTGDYFGIVQMRLHKYSFEAAQAAPGGNGLAGTITGDFSGVTGSNFDGGLMDVGQAAWAYGGDVYTAGISSGQGGAIIKYDSSGNVLSSAALGGGADFGFTAVRVNPNGVYLAAQGTGTGFVLAKYTNNLVFVSSTALAGDSSARDLALDAAGDVYVVGSNRGEAGSLNDYKIAKFSQSLAFISSRAYNAGGTDEGRGIAVYGNYLYVTGTSLQGSATHYVTVKLFADTLGNAGFFYDYGGPAYGDAVHPLGGKIAVAPGGQDIYVVNSSSYTEILTTRLDTAMALVSSATFSSPAYAQGVDVRVNVDTEVFVLGGYNGGSYDYPVVLKYDRNLVYLSSAAAESLYGFEPVGLALELYGHRPFATGAHFSDGTQNKDAWNMRTVGLPAMPDAVPVVRQVSGTAIYGTSYDPAAVLTVWVSSTADFSDFVHNVHIPAPGLSQPFSITGIPPGTYYMAMTVGQGQVAYSTEPWGVHGQLGTPTPIDLTGNDATGITVVLTDGNDQPNPWSPQTSLPAVVNCPQTFANGGACRINGASTYSTALAVDASSNRYLLATNLTDSAIVKYSAAGAVASSVTVKFAAFNDIKVSPVNGDLYVAAQGPVSGIRLYRYTPALVLVSSLAIPGYQGARQLDFGSSGDVYAVSTIDNGSGTPNYDIRLIKADAALSAKTDDWSASSPGADQGYGIHVAGTDVFVTGIQRPGAFGQVAVMRVDATSVMSQADSAILPTAPFTFPEGVGFNNIRVTADASGVYVGYSADLLTSTGTAVYRYARSAMSNGYSSATVAASGAFGDMKLNGSYFYVAAQSVANQARVTKYSAAGFSQTGSSIAAVPGGYGMAPGGMSFGPAGEVYLSGVMPSGGPLVSAGVANLGAIADIPVEIYISTWNAAPGIYLAGQEAAALRLDIHTLIGSTDLTNIRVHVNPSGPYTDVSAVGLYADSNQDGVWSLSDEFVSSAAVTSAYADLPLPTVLVNAAPGPVFITLTAAPGASGSSVNLQIDSSAAFTTSGNMASQAVYPVVSAAASVTVFAPASGFTAGIGANLEGSELSWTYPQAISGGHFIIGYSTAAADLAGPDSANRIIGAISGVAAGSAGAYPLSGLPVVTSGLRVFPYHFALWLYNGVSTSAVSSAQNLYFPAGTVGDGDASLRISTGMTGALPEGVKFARTADGPYAAATFYTGVNQFIALKAPSGAESFYYSPTERLQLKALSADDSGNAYALIQKSTSVVAAKMAPSGAVLWSRVINPDGEDARALVWGGAAVYAATEFIGVTRDIRVRRINEADGSVVSTGTFDSSPSFGANSEDEVNGIAFSAEASGRYIYAAGAAGQYPTYGSLVKFADTGTLITTSTVFVAGNWPVRYYNPDWKTGAMDARALLVKTDLNGNLVVAGAEQRYDLSQGLNIWVNRYNSYGTQMFTSPAAYNNALSNSDDFPAGLDLDSYGNIYVSGYTDMWPQGQANNMLLAKFGAGGQFMSARVYDSAGASDYGTDVYVSSDNYVRSAGVFGAGETFGVYSMPMGASVNAQFFSASEGPYTGSVDLMWNYTGRLPAGSTYYVQYTADAAPVWNRAGAQFVVHPPAQLPGAVQQHTVGALPALRYQATAAAAENRGNLYKFKVWITSGGLTTELPEVQSFARTPNAYDNSLYFGRERLSYMSGLSSPPGAVAAEEPYVYHAFAGRADGGNAGFGLRKYNADQYLEWTKFFNHRLNRSYQVGAMTRDSAGNFYIVGSQYLYNPNPTGPELLVGSKDIWIAKLNSAGDLLWSYASDASGLGFMDELAGASVEEVGAAKYLYVVGTTSTSANGMDILAKKFSVTSSTAPSLVWTYTAGGAGDDYGYSVAVGTAVYLAGTLKNASKDMAVLTLSKVNGTAAGTPIIKDYAGSDDAGYGLAVTTTTPPYLYLGGSVGKMVGTAYADYDAVLYKLTPGGEVAWSSLYNGKDNLDDAFYAVRFYGDSVIAAGYETTASQGRNAIYREFLENGTPEWVRGFDFSGLSGLGTGHDAALGLDVGASGRIYSAVAIRDDNPGLYYFPEPDFSVEAYGYYVPGSVRLEWMSQEDLPAATQVSVQYSTYTAGMPWDSASAQVRFNTTAAVATGMNMERVIYGLNTGRDQQGGAIGPVYYFMVWTGAGGPVSATPAAARASEGWSYETMAMYPNEAKLFVMGAGQQAAYYNSWEKEFPGVARDSSGNLYSLASMDWNGHGGLAIKKFNSSLAPLWTKYYAPGEWFQMKGNRMTADAAGNLYVTGYQRDPMGATGKDLFVLKFGENGVAWKSVLDFAGGDDAGYGVALDADGNVYASGSAYAGPGQGQNVFLAKFASDGAFISSANYNGSANGSDSAYGLAVQGNNLYAAGTVEQTGLGSQFWVGRFRASDLGLDSMFSYGENNDNSYEESAYNVAIDSMGFVYAAGQAYENSNYSVDAILYKSSADFSASWAEPAEYNSQANGQDAAHTVALGTDGGVYVAGYTERYDINQDRNLWLRKYGPDGVELWTQEFNSNAFPGDYSMGPNADQGFSLAVGTMGFVSVGGKFNNYYGLYRYKQTSTLSVKPTLTVTVSSVAAATPFPGVGVTLIPFSPTGGIDVMSSTSAVTNSSGVAVFQVPAGKQYFIALDKQGYNPNIKDQQMDPYGSYFVQLNADMAKSYVLTPRPAADPYYPLTVRITSATANDYIVAEVFFTQTGEKAAYGIGRVPAGVTATTVTITNVPPAAAGAYTLGITIPNRGLARSVPMAALFPQTSAYWVIMSTMSGAVASTGGFEVGASTTPPSVEGVARNARTLAPLEQVRIRLWNSVSPCLTGNCDYNVYETLTDVNGKYEFYNVVSSAAYNLSAQKGGYKRDGYNGLAVAAATLNRDFQLAEATYTLRGYIRYRDVPVPNADVMIWGDSYWYSGGADSYRNGRGMDSDARVKTAADGSFLFSTATANGLPDGQVRMSAAFFGNWLDLNEGNIQNFAAVDADDVRIVVSSQGAAGAGACSKGRVWKLRADTGACQSYGDMNFNIMPPSQNDSAVLSGSVTFVTSFTVTAASPLVISSMSPVTVMAQQDCSDCKNKSMGFAVISGTYTVSYATYSITLSTGVSYYTRVTSNEWGEISAFDDRADFRSTTTTSVAMNFVVTKAGKLTGVVKMPDGSSYKPYNSGASGLQHRMNISVVGQNVNVSEGWGVDDYGAFEFPNLAPGLYTVTMRPEGEGFRWAAPPVYDVAVVAGKTTQVTLKLENGLYVQPQIIGLPEISTPTWAYLMIPVESGTEMNQKRVTEMFFGSDVFAFNYSTTTQTWDKKIMQVGQYDFYLMMGVQYNPEGGNGKPVSFDQFGNFIGKVKAFNVQRNEATPNLGTEAQPIPVSVLGSLGQDTFEGTIVGGRMYTDNDLDRIFSNFNELYPVIPAVMVYDAAGDLRGYTAGLPTEADFPAFWNAMGLKDKALMRNYFAANKPRFMVPNLPPGRYTVVFNNPNYPPMAKEIDIPLSSSYNGIYPFDFDEQRVRVGSIYGMVRSTETGSGLSNAVVYLKHKTVEKFANTAADGSFTFDNLPSGIYRLEVTREGFVKTGQKTTLASGASSELAFYMSPTQSNMTGKVYLSKFPAPVTKSGVKIVAYDETYNVEHPEDYLPKIEATTNDAGEYELTGIVPGHVYKVSAFYSGKLPSTLDVSSDTVTEGTTYLPDIVLREVAPQITVKVRKSPDSASKVDVTIKSPKQLVTTPVCKVNPGETYVSTTAVSLALVPGPNNTYLGQFTASRGQEYYNVYVAAGDGSSRMEKSVTYSPNNQAKTEQYIQSEAIQGGEVQMDRETEEYSGIELDAGALTATGSGSSAYGVSAFGPSANGGLVGGFFSALPSVRTVKTAKGDLSLTQAIQDLMASEVYNMELDNAQANKSFTLTLKYDKEKAAENANLRIYQYNAGNGGWDEVPGNYTTDPMLGVLSVDVASLSGASQGASAARTPLGRKRLGMSAVVNGRYTPSAAGSSQSGRFAVFSAMPGTGVNYTGTGYEVYNMPNPFSLKDKTVTGLEGTAAFNGATTYVTRGTLIKYHLPAGKSGNVKFVIYNLAGEKVRTISDGSRTGGQIYYSEWDGRNDTSQDAASGVYFMLTYVNGEQLGTKAHKLAVIK